MLLSKGSGARTGSGFDKVKKFRIHKYEIQHFFDLPWTNFDGEKDQIEKNEKNSFFAYPKIY
jgi:hypothetical protein